MNAYQRDHLDLHPREWPDPPPETVRAHHYTREEATGIETIVMYDRENPLAWIQASTSVALNAVR